MFFIFLVFEWHIVIVASNDNNNDANGFPTRLLLPMITTCFLDFFNFLGLGL
jgi:hypothetical protein